MSVLLWTAVVLIGGAGSVVRFVVDDLVGAQLGRRFPFGTLAINLSGSAILGLLAGLAVPHDAALLAGTAAVGSYTTFSTWMFESQRLSEERRAGKGAINLTVSLALGIAAAALGRWIAGAL